MKKEINFCRALFGADADGGCCGLDPPHLPPDSHPHPPPQMLVPLNDVLDVIMIMHKLFFIILSGIRFLIAVVLPENAMSPLTNRGFAALKYLRATFFFRGKSRRKFF